MLVRSGECELGAKLIDRSRRHFEAANLSTEAMVLAEWFQTPAEAYVQYRRGDTSGAEALLLQAVEACIPLRARYGYRVELRRIHLARNVVRVRDEAGRPLEALELAHQLVDYIEGVSEAWPWPQSVVVEPDVPDLDVRLVLTDQVLGDVARLLSTTRPDARDLLRTARRPRMVPS